MKDGEYIPLSSLFVFFVSSVFMFLAFSIYNNVDYENLHGEKKNSDIVISSTVNVKDVKSEKARGLRNNNPLNIRYSKKTHWLGRVYNKSDSDFEEFTSVSYGFRAAYKTLVTYKEKYNINTIEGIVYRFSPPKENDTEGIINNLENMTGLKRGHNIMTNDYPLILQKMALMESGKEYSIDFIKSSINLN